MDGDAFASSSSFGEYQTRLQDAVLQPTKLALGLPKDIAFHRTLDRAFAEQVDECSSRVLALANKLIKLGSLGRGASEVALSSEDDVIDNFHSFVVDVMDRLLEQADTCIDEHLGRNKAAATRVVVNEPKAPTIKHKGPLDKRLLHDPTIRKPQLDFSAVINNFSTSWHPSLREKHHSKCPTEDHVDVDSGLPYHPYRYEISHIDYPEHNFDTLRVHEVKTFEDTPFTLVTTPQEFSRMLVKLEKAQELAVDLEHHSYRTYMGFLCLMQISDRKEDWVVDLLAVRDQVSSLNSVFANPNIVKVFHGAESDIVWLQQDFSIYVVNLFDTYHASKVLEFPKHSLASLLETYTDFTPDKRYQLADWRIRPIPAEMLVYARSDTHFLLYIYDRLREQLLQRAEGLRDLIHEVLRRSEETALRTYVHEVYDIENGSGTIGWASMAKKWNKSLYGVRFSVYKAVHQWRDTVAREEDESPRYVMGNNAVFKLADAPPDGLAQLSQLLHPFNAILRKRSKELLDVIAKAVKSYQEPTDTPALPTKSNPFSIGAQSSPIDLTAASDAQRNQLWDFTRNGDSANEAGTSVLFGVNFVPSWQDYCKHSSALFGDPSATDSAKSKRYLEVVQKIHSTLMITPTLPQVVDEVMVDAKPQEVLVSTSTDFIPTPSAPEAIPFVPKAGRTVPVADPDVADDDIVIVGQRQKKRKRGKVAVRTDDGPAGSVSEEVQTARRKKSKTEPTEDRSHVEFDYSAAPNLLDNEEAHVSTAGKEKKVKAKVPAKKPGAIEYGSFPKPPRNRSEMKAGNISRTFR